MHQHPVAVDGPGQNLQPVAHAFGACLDTNGGHGDPAVEAYVAEQLDASDGPIIAASDYVRAVPEAVRAYIPPERRFVTLGTDGFGRSDTRAALRSFFGVGAAEIADTALVAR